MKKYMLPSGFHYLLDGFAMLFRPGLKRFLLLPLLVNILFFSALFFFLDFYFNRFTAWFDASVPSWLVWLDTVLWLFFLLGFFVVCVSGFTVLMTVIAAPFNSLLAEKAEAMLTHQPLPALGWLDTLKDAPRVLGRQLCVIGYYLPRAFGILLLFVIPLVNLAAPFLWFLFNAWFICMQFLDFPTDNHRVPMRQVRQKMSQYRWHVLTLGAAILFALMIPVVNLCTMPAAVIAATRLWIDIRSPLEEA